MSIKNIIHAIRNYETRKQLKEKIERLSRFSETPLQFKTRYDFDIVPIECEITTPCVAENDFIKHVLIDGLAKELAKYMQITQEKNLYTGDIVYRAEIKILKEREEQQK